MKIEPTLLGVIIGSGLSLVGNFLTQWATIWKEERQWKRQQTAEEQKTSRIDTKEKIESVKNIVSVKQTASFNFITAMA